MRITLTAPATPKFNDKTKEVQPNKYNYIAESFWTNYGDVIYCQQKTKFYQWDWRIYKEISELDLLRLMRVRFPQIAELALGKREEVIQNYREFSCFNIEQFDKDDGLTLQNKYFDMTDYTAKNHDKSRINTIALEYDYIPEAICPLWITFLNSALEENQKNIECLQEFFGYCLTKNIGYEKTMWLTGEGANGKGVILNALIDMVGLDNISVVSLRHFNDSKRLRAMENKLVNICSEVPKKVEDYEADFKKIASGELIEIEPKYIDAYKIMPFCKLIFAANDIPRIDDHSNAFYRRILTIDMKKEIEEEAQDRQLRKKIRTELPGIFNWAIAGLKRLRERGYFLIDDEMKQEIKDIKMQNNPVALWARERIVPNKEKYLTKGEIYKDYHLWCNLNGHKPTGMARFSVEFYRIFKLHTKKNARHATGDRAMIWPSLTWAGNETVTEQIEWND